MPVIDPPYVPTLYSGDVIIRVKPGTQHAPEDFDVPDWLIAEVTAALADSVAEAPEHGVPHAAPTLVERLIQSLSPAEILSMEADATGPYAPLHSLTTYFRVWLRDRPPLGPSLVKALLGHSDVDRAWLETTASPAARGRVLPAVSPSGRPPSIPRPRQAQRPPMGVGVDDVWHRPGADGTGRGIYVVESGWRIQHQGLRRAKIRPVLWGDNAGDRVPGDVFTQDWANHGTSTLGVLVGDHGVGIVPQATVTPVSCLDAATGSREHVADAIIAALIGATPGSVLLLEVQRGVGLPTEVEDPDLDAIRLAVSRGVTVIEPAGNAGYDLDTLGGPRSFDPLSPTFIDSGAILVGALGGLPPAGPSPVSCQGRRVDAWAHGEGVETTGAPFGTALGSVADIDGMRRGDFNGTSAASAVVAGAVSALLGVEARAVGRAPHPHDTREHVRKVTNARAGKRSLPALGALVATPVQRTRPLPKVGPLAHPPRPKPGRNVSPALAVSHPQTSEGNTNVRGSKTLSDPVNAWVYLPHPAGSNVFCLPGGTPTAGSTQWTETWEHYDLAKSLGVGLAPPFQTFWFHFASSGLPTRPVGVGATVATSSLTFKYTAVPTAVPAHPAFTEGHFEVWVWWGFPNPTSALAGEMRRFIDVGSKSVREFWMLNASYRFPSADYRVEVRFIPPPLPTTFAAWFATWQTSTTAPPWHVDISYGW